ncbi:MAG: hypothetical protein H6502_03305 [Candidatus Woesearchaeota archaeon]|nr:MAG: hypothetical protein H6502_03305 [Candidatus Woesearchaeota archaeon]
MNKKLTKKSAIFLLVGLLFLSVGALALYPGSGPFHEVLYVNQLRALGSAITFSVPVIGEEVLVTDSITLGGETRSEWPDASGYGGDSCVVLTVVGDDPSEYPNAQDEVLLDDLPCNQELFTQFGSYHPSLAIHYPNMSSNFTEKSCTFTYEYSIFTGPEYFSSRGIPEDGSYNHTQGGRGVVFFRNVVYYPGASPVEGYPPYHNSIDISFFSGAFLQKDYYYTNLYAGPVWDYATGMEYESSWLYTERSYNNETQKYNEGSSQEWHLLDSYEVNNIGSDSYTGYGYNDPGDCVLYTELDGYGVVHLRLEAEPAQMYIANNNQADYPVQCKIRFCG